MPFNSTAAQIATALRSLSNIGTGNLQATGGPVNTANVLVTWKGTFEEQNVSTLTSDATGLTGATPTVTIGVGTGAGGNNTSARQGGLWRMPAADSARSAMNTNDLRGKLLRIKVKDTHHPGRLQQGRLWHRRRIHDPGRQPLPARRRACRRRRRGPRSTRWASGTRSGCRSTRTTSRTSATTRPTRAIRSSSAGLRASGRFQIVRHPANYGWPYCYGKDLAQYPWNVNLQVPMNLNNHQPVPAGQTPQPYDCANPAGVPNNDYWNLNGGPSVEPGLAVTPPLTEPDIWYSYDDNRAVNPWGRRASRPTARTLREHRFRARPRSVRGCSPSSTRTASARTGSPSTDYDPANPNPKKFPPYYDNSVVLGEFTQDTLRELKIDSQNRVFKINQFLPCGAANQANPPFMFECDNPMDLQWGADGEFYLLTYGDGFFNINADAGMYKWQYVKGLRAPVAVLSADRTDGPLPLTVNFSSAGSSDPDPGDSISFDWDFGDGSPHSIDPNPTHTYPARGRYTAVLTVTDSSGRSAGQQTTITAGNSSPTVVVNTPVAGGTFAFGDDIPFTVTVTDPEDGAIVCSEVQVTFVLGHDTHGHAEAGTTGCSGVLHTDAGDVSHGGNVFGVVSATYTDHGVGHDNVQTLTTTSQTQIRQKHQEVEFVVSQSGTNTATNTDGGPAAAGSGHAPRQPRGRRLDPAQRAVQPAEHRLRDVPRRGRGSGPHRGLAARGDRGSPGRGRPGRSCRRTTWSRRAARPPGRARRSRSRSRARTSCSSCSARSPTGHRQQPVQPQLGRVRGVRDWPAVAMKDKTALTGRRRMK